MGLVEGQWIPDTALTPTRAAWTSTGIRALEIGPASGFFDVPHGAGVHAEPVALELAARAAVPGPCSGHRLWLGGVTHRPGGSIEQASGRVHQSRSEWLLASAMNSSSVRTLASVARRMPAMPAELGSFDVARLSAQRRSTPECPTRLLDACANRVTGSNPSLPSSSCAIVRRCAALSVVARHRQRSVAHMVEASLPPFFDPVPGVLGFTPARVSTHTQVAFQQEVDMFTGLAVRP